MLLSDNIINTEMLKKHEGNEYVLINYDVDPDGVKAARNLNTVSPAEIHIKLVKSHYSVFGEGSQLNGADIAIELMAHFRFLTPDQYIMIFPQHTRQYLINLCNHGKRKKYVKTGFLTDGTAYYYLSDAGLEYIRSLYPPEYNRLNRIPSSAGDAPKGTRSVHEVGIRDVPYICLAESYIKPFDWYSSVILEEKKTPYESVLAAINTDPKKEITNGKKKKGKVVADGIMLFDKERAWIIEQDRGTEDKAKIKNKIINYGEYFNKIDCSQLQLIFNVRVPQDPVKKHKAGQGIKASLDRIKDMMLTYNMKTLDECRKKLAEHVKKENGTNRRQNNMLEVLNKYKDSHDNLSVGYKSLYDSFLPLAGKKEKTKDGKSFSKARKIRSTILEFLKSTYPSHPLREAVEHGLPIIITSDFKNSLYYTNPCISGLMDKFIKWIKPKYPESCSFVTKEYCKFQHEYIALRNLLFVKGADNYIKGCYIFAEISNDVAAYFGLSYFLKNYEKKNYVMHFIIFVSNTKDAIDFHSENDVIRTFSSTEEMTRYPLYGDAIIRFYDYSENGLKWFVVDEDGKCVKTKGY
ncbi:MAG: replication-relaxation family protein [Lachnospiraceae bacterium]|nr:replication-relaxation family protein [Lachnospiraceae bacterium]